MARRPVFQRKDKGKCHCPRDYSDRDAQWGAKSKDYIFFGDKVHLIVDAKSQLPLEGAKEWHPQLKIDSSSMDSAYDSYENYRFAIEEIKVAPIITLNPRGGIDAITRGSLCLSEDGSYIYVAGFKVLPWEEPG